MLCNAHVEKYLTIDGERIRVSGPCLLEQGHDPDAGHLTGNEIALQNATVPRGELRVVQQAIRDWKQTGEEWAPDAIAGVCAIILGWEG